MTIAMLECGCAEPFKATVHGLALMLASAMMAYNGAAWLQRRERHLAVNTLLYGLATWWEWRQVTGHIDRLLDDPT